MQVLVDWKVPTVASHDGQSRSRDSRAPPDGLSAVRHLSGNRLLAAASAASAEPVPSTRKAACVPCCVIDRQERQAKTRLERARRRVPTDARPTQSEMQRTSDCDSAQEVLRSTRRLHPPADHLQPMRGDFQSEHQPRWLRQQTCCTNGSDV